MAYLILQGGEIAKVAIDEKNLQFLKNYKWCESDKLFILDFFNFNIFLRFHDPNKSVNGSLRVCWRRLMNILVVRKEKTN